MSKTRMIFYGALGSLVSVLIWSFIGGCHTSSPETPVPPSSGAIAPAEIAPPAEVSEEVLIEEGIIDPDQPPALSEPVAVAEKPAPEKSGPDPEVSAPEPEKAVRRIHTVEKGESLWGISRQYGVSLDSIVEANGLADPDRLSLGQQLVIPASPE